MILKLTNYVQLNDKTEHQVLHLDNKSIRDVNNSNVYTNKINCEAIQRNRFKTIRRSGLEK